MQQEKQTTALNQFKNYIKKIALEAKAIDCKYLLSEFDKYEKIERQQIEDAFNESRLTHPMIGFKHNTFDEYFNENFTQQQ